MAVRGPKNPRLGCDHRQVEMLITHPLLQRQAVHVLLQRPALRDDAISLVGYGVELGADVWPLFNA